MNKWLVLLIGLNLIMIGSNSHARRPRPSPIVMSGINNRHVDIIIVAQVVDIDRRIVDRTEEEIKEAKTNWERKVRIYERTTRINHMNPLSREQRDEWKKRELSKNVNVASRILKIEKILKGDVKEGKLIRAEWIMTNREIRRTTDIPALTMHNLGNMSVLSLRNPYAGLGYQLEPNGLNIGNLDDVAIAQHLERIKNLIGRHIAYMDFLTEHYDKLTPRGRRNLMDLWGPLGDIDRETLIADWRKERARFKEWNEYELTDAVKKRLIVDKPADEEMRD